MEDQLKDLLETYRTFTIEELKIKYEEIRQTPGYVSTKGLTLLAIQQLIDEKEEIK